MKAKSKIEMLRDLLRHGSNSGLSPAQLQRVSEALKRLQLELATLKSNKEAA